MSINLEYYKIFYYVAKLEGITSAAEELAISQPAVSQAVKQLETALGTVLFVRTGRGVHLTPAGEMFYSYVKRGYEYICLGEEKLKEMLDLESGEIRIGASDMTLKYYLLNYLQRFHEEFPKVKLTVTNGPTPETLRYLQEGRIDFGVVTQPFEERADLEARPVRSIQDIFVAGAKFSYLKNARLSFSDLEDLPVICLEKNTSTRRYMDRVLAENGVILNPEIELATSDILVQFAKRDLGIAEIVKDFALPFLESGELFELKLDNEIPSRQICLVQDKKNPPSAAAQKLIGGMGECCLRE